MALKNNADFVDFIEQDKKYLIGIDLGSRSLAVCIADYETGKPLLTPIYRFGDDDDDQAEVFGEKRRIRRTRRRAKRRREDFIRFFGTFLDEIISVPDHSDVYSLRVKALDEQITLKELFICLAHLGKRRGFKSSRKERFSESKIFKDEIKKKKKEDVSVVLSQIKSTEEKMKELDARTYAEFLLLSKEEFENGRFRNQYISRSCVESEFHQIMKAQKEFYPDIIDEDFVTKIYGMIFRQRSLASQKHRREKCQFEKNLPRAPKCSFDYQRYQVVQLINNIKVDGKSLSDDQKTEAFKVLHYNSSVKISEFKKAVGISKDEILNYEGEVRTFQGNQVESDLIGIFGEEWRSFSDSKKKEIVAQIKGCIKENTIKKIAKEKWGLSSEKAEELSSLKMPEGFNNLSNVAIKKITNEMKQKGITQPEAIFNVYGDNKLVEGPFFQLPSPKHLSYNPQLFSLANKLRKVMNEIVRLFGYPPELIIVEDARDVILSSKRKKEYINKTKKNKKITEEAKAQIQKVFGFSNPNKQDINTFILWQVQNKCCAYCGKKTDYHKHYLGSGSSSIELDHILVRSKGGSNGLNNRLLSCQKCNRDRGNKTLLQFLGEEGCKQLISRVKAFDKNKVNPKAIIANIIKENESTEELYYERMNNSDLNFTREACRKTAEYLCMFYGKEWRKHILTVHGTIVAYLRNQWLAAHPDLKKDRENFLHHSVDAMVISQCRPSCRQKVAKIFSSNEKINRKVPLPYGDFVDDLRKVLSNTIVQSRVRRKINQKMHEESHYGRSTDPETGEKIITIRKPVEKIMYPVRKTKTKDDLIVDVVSPTIREALLLAKEKDKKEKEKGKNPVVDPTNGKVVRSARVRTNVVPEPVGYGENQRLVKPGGNHHLEIFGLPNGKFKWKVIRKIDVMRLYRDGKSIYSKEDEDGNPLVMHLQINELVKVNHKGIEKICYVQKMDINGNIAFREHWDMRRKDGGKNVINIGSADRLMNKYQAKKLKVNMLGMLIEEKSLLLNHDYNKSFKKTDKKTDTHICDGMKETIPA